MTPKFFYRPDALPAAQPTASKYWRQCKWTSKVHAKKQQLVTTAPWPSRPTAWTQVISVISSNVYSPCPVPCLCLSIPGSITSPGGLRRTSCRPSNCWTTNCMPHSASVMPSWCVMYRSWSLRVNVLWSSCCSTTMTFPESAPGCNVTPTTNKHWTTNQSIQNNQNLAAAKTIRNIHDDYVSLLHQDLLTIKPKITKSS